MQEEERSPSEPIAVTAEWSEEQIQASQIAGLQSMINGWTINIQMLEAKIEEIKTKIDNIKKNYSIDK